MFKRHGGKKAKGNDSSGGGSGGGGGGGGDGSAGSDPAAVARYKNQAAKAREKIVSLVKARDLAELNLTEKTNEADTLTTERDDLLERTAFLESQVNKLQEERDSSVEAKEEAETNLEVALDSQRFAEIKMRNAEEDADVQRRSKEKAAQECNALKDSVAQSKEQRNAAKKELAHTDHLLNEANLNNRIAKAEITRLEHTLTAKTQEMRLKLAGAALELQRSRALGEDRESELNRWVEKLTNQIFSLRKETKRKAELAKAGWRKEQDTRLTRLIQEQEQQMQSNRHNLLLSLSDPLLHTPNGQPVKKKIRRAREQIKTISIQLQHTTGELTRLRNTTNVVEQLVAASADGNVQAVRQLVRSHPSNVSSLNGRRQSAIQAAAREGHVNCACILLEHGADAEPIHEMGTPLYLSSRYGHADVVALLMKAKYHIPQFVPGMNDGRTALHAACCNGHLKCVQLLLRKFPQNVNVEDQNNMSPLHLVCTKREQSRLLAQGRCEIVRLLLKRGAYVSARDNAGNTPIIHAAMSGCLELVNTLCVEAGANILDRNRAGKSPIDEARVRKDTNMMQRLNELQKSIPRSVVLASRFAGYNVKTPSSMQQQQQQQFAHVESSVTSVKHEHRIEIMGRMASKESGGGGAVGRGGGQVVEEEEEDHMPDASELLVMQSRPTSRF